jgi:predicted transcriptional regulator
MFEKCIKCQRIGISCVPNLMLLPFADLIQWCAKRQKHLEWTNQALAEISTVPVGTINRIKAGDYADCKYSTIKHLLIALIGGTTDEFSCTEQVERELQQKEELERQADRLSIFEKENEFLKSSLKCQKEQSDAALAAEIAEKTRLMDALLKADAQHREDIRAIKAEYVEQIEFMKEEVKSWRSLCQAK